MRFGLLSVDDVSVNQPIVIFGVDRIMCDFVLVFAVFHCHQRFVSDFIGIHNESVTGVKRVHFKWGLVFLAGFIGQNQTVGRSADHLPLYNLLVLRGFVLCEHQLIQSGNPLGDALVSASANVLNRLTAEIANLEGDNLVRPVLHNPIADFGTDIFHPVQNRLFALVVIPQVINLTSVEIMVGKCFLQNCDHILVRNFFHAGLDNPSATHLSGFAHRLGSVDYISQDCPSFPQKSKRRMTVCRAFAILAIMRQLHTIFFRLYYSILILESQVIILLLRIYC